MKKHLSRSPTARRALAGGFIQRVENDASGAMSTAGQTASSQQIDVDELVERIYRRWQDELRRERERERGIW